MRWVRRRILVLLDFMHDLAFVPAPRRSHVPGLVALPCGRRATGELKTHMGLQIGLRGVLQIASVVTDAICVLRHCRTALCGHMVGGRERGNVLPGLSLLQRLPATVRAISALSR